MADGDDDLVKRAEREVVDAAVAWAEERARNRKPSSTVSQRLQAAAVLLRTTRRATGRFKAPIPREEPEDDK